MLGMPGQAPMGTDDRSRCACDLDVLAQACTSSAAMHGLA